MGQLAPNDEAVPAFEGRNVVGTHKRGLALWAKVLLAVVPLLAAAVAAAWVMWPRASLSGSPTSLAKFTTSGLPLSVKSLSATLDGKEVPVKLVSGGILPTAKVPAGSAITVKIVLNRPSWLRSLGGPTLTVIKTVRTPTVTVLNPIVIGSSITSYFSSPVKTVRIASGNTLLTKTFSSPSTKFQIFPAGSTPIAGTVEVQAASQAWETLPAPVAVTYFRDLSAAPVAVLSPGTASLAPTSPLTLTLSERVSAVFGNSHPVITPSISGAAPVVGNWIESTPYTLVFTPSAPDFWPGESFSLKLPAAVQIASPSGAVGAATRSVVISGSAPSITRLQQLLAELNYLPVGFQPPANQPKTVSGLATTLSTPAAGNFNWRFSAPAPLAALWQPGVDTVMTRGALMSFEQFNGLDDNGLANPLLWPTLLKDVAAQKLDPHRYSWIEVSKQLPETLWLYENGKVVLTSPTNTGIAGLGTQSGTYPIYLRFTENYMSGTNPNGTHYHDLVHWINYFHGSQAVHGFPRAQYGYPQSLGCVELPIGTAGVIYPQVHLGTLVTIL